MDWKLDTFDWNQARAFLATVEEGSLSAAARVLGLTQPTLGRQVAALEEQLDIVLFERVGRSLVLTPSGVELLDHVRDMYDAATRVSLAASGQSQTIEGKICITASDLISAYVLPPAIIMLQNKAPLVEVEMVATNEISNLQLREADIAIRHVRPEQPDLVARLVSEHTARFYASNEYLDQHGRPKSLTELDGHEFIGFGNSDQMIDYFKPLGISLASTNFRLGSENGIVAWKLAQNGLGIIIMSDKIAASDKNMVRVLPQMDPITFPIWLVAHRELHTSRRVRLVFDLLADYLANDMNTLNPAL